MKCRETGTFQACHTNNEFQSTSEMTGRHNLGTRFRSIQNSRYPSTTGFFPLDGKKSNGDQEGHLEIKRGTWRSKGALCFQKFDHRSFKLLHISEYFSSFKVLDFSEYFPASTKHTDLCLPDFTRLIPASLAMRLRESAVSSMCWRAE